MRSRHLLVLLLSSACTGQISGPAPATSGPEPSSPDAPDDRPRLPDEALCFDRERAVPEGQLWLLTASQHRNALRDLFGEDAELPTVLVPGVRADTFLTPAADYAVGPDLLSQHQGAARAAADHVQAHPEQTPCAADDEGCLRAHAQELARRAFRRPLDDTERSDLDALFTEGASGGDPMEGLAWVVEAVLISPDFLYRTELGAPGAGEGERVYALSAHELATSVSMFLRDGPPDAELREAADDGSLLEPAVLAAQVDRLLATPEVQAHLVDVFARWIGADRVLSQAKDPGLFPDFDVALAQSMAEQTRRFIASVLWERGGSLEALLASRETFVDARLAAFYGVPHESSDPDAFVPVTLPADERAGILTHAGILAGISNVEHRDIVRRGLFVAPTLLCAPPPPPVPDLGEAAEAATAGLSEREMADYRLETAPCSGCHREIDPVGIALEAYDATGRLRADDYDDLADVPIGDRRVTVAGAVELAEELAQSDEVASCVLDQMMQYGVGRPVSGDEGCTLLDVHDAFEASGGDLVEAFRAITLTRAFTHRRGAL